MTTATLASFFNKGRFPTISDPKVYKQGISKGKLKGVITATGP
jgi:hypothetical protein